MNSELDTIEARVLGVLMEKEVTTPDAYPLSVNAIVSACNQKSNRHPVMQLTEDEVQAAVERLIEATLVTSRGAAGGRVTRYAHRLATRLFGEYEFSPAERAVLCVLLLRGAQTPGEIRAHAGRLHEFADTGELEAVLKRLASREDGPHVAELAREPGRRESRWVQCFCEQPVTTAPVAVARSDGDRLATLTRRVERLEAQIARLHEALGIETEDDTPDGDA